MKRLLACVIGISVSASASLAGQATAVAVATRGGSASATATANRGGDSTAIAGATNGGEAVATSDARGYRGGLAISRSVATADHGRAVSHSTADAFGNAVAESDSYALAIDGDAYAESHAEAERYRRGRLVTRSTATAIDDGGFGIGESVVLDSRPGFGHGRDRYVTGHHRVTEGRKLTVVRSNRFDPTIRGGKLVRVRDGHRGVSVVRVGR